MYEINIKEYEGDFEKDKVFLGKLIKKRVNGDISKEEFEQLKKINSRVFGYVNEVRRNLMTIFSDPVKEHIGHGQDNVVYNYKNNWVVKIMAKKKYEGYEKLKDYFTYKYKLLKKTVGKYIPDTYFLEGETLNSEPIHYNNLDNYEVKYKTIYTAQRKIKGYTLSDLPTDIRKKGRLLEQLKKLYLSYIKTKLYMHYIEYKKYGKIGKLKFKMDIGKLSHRLDVDDKVLMSYKTPNIMYDIEKDKLFLIDFDTGSLNKETKAVFDIVNQTSKEEILNIGAQIFKKIKNEHIKLTPKILENFFKEYIKK